MNLLLINDGPLASALISALRQERYLVEHAMSYEHATTLISSKNYDTILIDLDIVDADGLIFLKNYRCEGGRAHVLITTSRDIVSDRVKALDLGADDYMVKPIDTDEMKARIRALLRSRQRRKPPVMTHADLHLDKNSHEVLLQTKTCKLLPREFSLLQVFMAEPERVFSKAELLGKLYGWDMSVGINTIEAHVCSLRRKIGHQRIVTVRGAGYRITGNVERPS